MMNKKILFISPQPFFQWRGSPIRVKFNLLALNKLGYQVDLLTLPIGDDIDIDQVVFHRVANPFKVQNIPIGPSLWKVFFDILLFIRALSLCRKNRYDIIHGIEEAGFIAAILAKLFKIKVIYEKHSDPLSHKAGRIKNLILGAYANVEKMSVKMADAVIGTGPGLVDQVNTMQTKTRAFNIFDIPSSLREPSLSDIQEKRSELLDNPNEVIVTFVGSFAVYQGVDLLFATIPEVVKHTKNVRFIVIGGTTEEIAARRRELDKNGAGGNVTFLGKIAPDILPDFLAASDILLSPRTSGVNTPLKILDYLKAGRSIVATDIPSNRLLLDDNAAVFSLPQTKLFADAIMNLVNNEAKREQLGQTCRKMYEKTYTFEQHCRRLAECYDYVLQK